jgi:phage I-like protein
LFCCILTKKAEGILTKEKEKTGAPSNGPVVQAYTDDKGRLLLALDIPDGTEPPASFQLFGPGVTPTTKGDVLFDETSANSVMDALADHGKSELPVDYDHGMLSFVTTPDSGKAAGWFSPGVVDGALHALDVQWTPKADDALRNREFRYFSPAVELDAKTRRVTKLINVALTNLPATKGQSPLVASDNQNTAPGKGAPEDTAMNEKLLRILGADDEPEALVIAREHNKWMADVLTALGETKADGALTAIATLKRNASGLQEKLTTAEEQSTKLAATVAERETQLTELKAADEKRAHDALIGELSEAGKLPKALHEWARTISLEALKQFGEAATVVKPDATQPKPSDASTPEVTPKMVKVFKALGLDPEKIPEQLKADKARMAQLISESEEA